MDVFHVTERDGEKIRDKGRLNHMREALTSDLCFFKLPSDYIDVLSSEGEMQTKIMLKGRDRPEFLPEMCAVLTNLRCNVVNADVWTHYHKVVTVVYVTDDSTRSAITDRRRIARMKKHLHHVIRSSNKIRTPSPRSTPKSKRSNQMGGGEKGKKKTHEKEIHKKGLEAQVTVSDHKDRGYTLVVLQSRDKPRLLLDTAGALTDMQYVVFHGTIRKENEETYQEYYIRNMKGQPISSETERKHVKNCLEEAIFSIASEGLELELRLDDRFGLLSHIMNIFKEKGCWIKTAKILTAGMRAEQTFFVTDVSGKPVDPKTVDIIQRQMGRNILQVRTKFCRPPNLLERAAKNLPSSNLLRSWTMKVFKLFNGHRA